MAALDHLSERDKAVLRSIFDPTATIAADVVEDAADKFVEDEQGVRLAEAGKLDDALAAMTRAVEAAPDRAAAYNDRAQLLRMMMKDDDAMADLNRALDLTKGKKTRARALALCQRGVLLRKQGNDDDARAVFTEAAKLGSGFAKKQVSS
ncbi:hypothetical protein HF086_011345 [Spodoptera exigua]|uniref:Tetratricopeptide repeat protein n=1 Tax=Spodoptera exigua TaxID=7107 RepID=A0A922SN99_SPOEX|nr:hypothetical protein HF086_011345 [Spodoptera exigua]